MKTVATFESLSAIGEPVHWAIGVFDGLHIGHSAVIASARQARDAEGGKLGVFTFDRHPISVVRPEEAPRRISSGEAERKRLFRELGVDILFSIHFDADLARMTALEFLDLLHRSCRIGSISVGEDWRFGRNRKGDVHLLNAEGERLGFPVYVHPHVVMNGERISSTRIRRDIERGDLDSVRALLGRPYTITGTVVHGKRLARQLGFPTANIRPDNDQLPPAGVYAARVELDGKRIDGIANLGFRPTVDGDSHELLLEVHLFDWKGDLYGRMLEVELINFLRPERKFDSIELLRQCMIGDCREARAILAAKG